MHRGPILWSVVLSWICAVILAGTATAAPTKPVEEVLSPSGFELQGTNGYKITGSVYQGGARGRGRLVLSASRGTEIVTYLAPAQVTPHSIRANLGKLGRVDLVLRRSGQDKTGPIQCLGESVTYETGTWEGLFEFDGEAGYTRARTTQVAGLPLLLFFGGLICSGESTGESFGPGEPGARLKGISYAGGRTITFQINKNRRKGKTLFSASLAERERGIKIHRELSGVAPANAFRYDRLVRTATLAPPAPFSGSARLRRSRNAVSPSWSGDLTLDFPGRSVPLAGPSFHVTLGHARITHGEDPGNITVGI